VFDGRADVVAPARGGRGLLPCENLLGQEEAIVEVWPRGQTQAMQFIECGQRPGVGDDHPQVVVFVPTVAMPCPEVGSAAQDIHCDSLGPETTKRREREERLAGGKERNLTPRQIALPRPRVQVRPEEPVGTLEAQHRSAEAPDEFVEPTRGSHAAILHERQKAQRGGPKRCLTPELDPRGRAAALHPRREPLQGPIRPSSEAFLAACTAQLSQGESNACVASGRVVALGESIADRVVAVVEGAVGLLAAQEPIPGRDCGCPQAPGVDPLDQRHPPVELDHPPEAARLVKRLTLTLSPPKRSRAWATKSWPLPSPSLRASLGGRTRRLSPDSSQRPSSPTSGCGPPGTTRSMLSTRSTLRRKAGRARSLPVAFRPSVAWRSCSKRVPSLATAMSGSWPGRWAERISAAPRERRSGARWPAWPACRQE